MTPPQRPEPRVILFPGEEPYIAIALGALSVGTTIAGLVITVSTPDWMQMIAGLYLVALAAAILGVRFGRARGRRTNGLKMLAMTTVLACVISVTVWTVLDSWSTIGKCEQRERKDFLTAHVWHEGTACTQEERAGYDRNL